MKCVVKLRKRGQVTIPREVLEALSLKPGELLELDVARVQRDVNPPA